MAEVGMHLWSSSGSTPLLRAGSSTAGYSESCPVKFWVSPGDSTTSLGSPFQCLTTLTVGKKNQQNNEISSSSVCARCLLSCPQAALRKVWFHLFHSTCQLFIFIHIDKIPLSLLLHRLKNPSSHSLSLYDRYPKTFIIFMVLWWTHSSMSLSLLHWGAHYWTQHCCVEGKDHLPWLAGNAFPSAAQGIVVLLWGQSTLLAHL